MSAGFGREGGSSAYGTVREIIEGLGGGESEERGEREEKELHCDDLRGV